MDLPAALRIMRTKPHAEETRVYSRLQASPSRVKLLQGERPEESMGAGPHTLQPGRSCSPNMLRRSASFIPTMTQQLEGASGMALRLSAVDPPSGWAGRGGAATEQGEGLALPALHPGSPTQSPRRQLPARSCSRPALRVWPPASPLDGPSSPSPVSYTPLSPNLASPQGGLVSSLAAMAPSPATGTTASPSSVTLGQPRSPHKLHGLPNQQQHSNLLGAVLQQQHNQQQASRALPALASPRSRSVTQQQQQQQQQAFPGAGSPQAPAGQPMGSSYAGVDASRVGVTSQPSSPMRGAPLRAHTTVPGGTPWPPEDSSNSTTARVTFASSTASAGANASDCTRAVGDVDGVRGAGRGQNGGGGTGLGDGNSRAGCVGQGSAQDHGGGGKRRSMRGSSDSGSGICFGGSGGTLGRCGANGRAPYPTSCSGTPAGCHASGGGNGGGAGVGAAAAVATAAGAGGGGTPRGGYLSPHAAHGSLPALRVSQSGAPEGALQTGSPGAATTSPAGPSTASPPSMAGATRRRHPSPGPVLPPEQVQVHRALRQQEQQQQQQQSQGLSPRRPTSSRAPAEGALPQPYVASASGGDAAEVLEASPRAPPLPLGALGLVKRESLRSLGYGTGAGAAAAGALDSERSRGTARLDPLRGGAQGRAQALTASGGIGSVVQTMAEEWAANVGAGSGADTLAAMASQLTRLPVIDPDKMKDPYYRRAIQRRGDKQTDLYTAVADAMKELPLSERNKNWRPNGPL